MKLWQVHWRGVITRNVGTVEILAPDEPAARIQFERAFPRGGMKIVRVEPINEATS